MDSENNNNSLSRPSFASVVAKGTVREQTVSMVTRQLNSTAINNNIRKQGVAFEALPENVPVEVYLEAISKTVPPKFTTHISKASRQIQVYFQSEMWAEKMISNGIDVKDYHLDVRPLAISPIKIIVSNVPPEICPTWLRNEISKFGRVVGPIKALFASTSRPEFSHIKSFRRVVLMEFDSDEALEKMPKQLNFSLDGKPYSFYLSVDVKCFKCGQMGHIRRSCPNSQPVSFSEKDSQISLNEKVPAQKNQPVLGTSGVASKFQPRENLVVSDTEMATVEEPGTRQKSESVLTKNQTSGDAEVPQSQQNENLQKKKTLKRRSSPSTEENAKVFAPEFLIPMQASSEDDYRTGADSDNDSQCSADQLEPGFLDTFTVETPLSIPELLNFLSDVKGSHRRYICAKKYTSDIQGLVSQLKSLCNYIKNSSVKSKTLGHARVMRVFKGLKEELESRS